MNDKQWGNIELPGLSDEELLNKDWNRITAARETVKKREKNGWKEKNEQRYQDPEYKQFWASSIKEAYKNPELRESQRQKGLSVVHTEQAKEKIRNANLGKQRKGESWIAEMAKKQIGNTRRARPLITPLGIFSSLKEAGIVHEQNGLGNAVNHLRKRIKEQWDGYKHITREEYMMLTGKEI